MRENATLQKTKYITQAKNKTNTHTHTVPYLESAKTAAWLNYARKSLPKKIAK